MNCMLYPFNSTSKLVPNYFLSNAMLLQISVRQDNDCLPHTVYFEQISHSHISINIDNFLLYNSTLGDLIAYMVIVEMSWLFHRGFRGPHGCKNSQKSLVYVDGYFIGHLLTSSSLTWV